MAVLILLGLFILLVLIYGFIKFLNTKTRKRFDFEFFSEKNLVPYVFINLGLYFGYEWYTEALQKNGDILNGILILFFACCLFIYVLVKNIKRTNYTYGILCTLLQFIIFIPGSLFGIAFIIGMLGISLQARPVYNIK